MVNKQIVYRIINNIESYLKDLEEVDKIKLTEYKNNVKTQRYIERTLQISIEAMFDIAHHIISDEKFREPDTYADAFKILKEQNVIDDSFLPTAQLMAQFRNKIVHYYENIDNELVFSIAKNKRNDFRKYVEMIKAWLSKY